MLRPESSTLSASPQPRAVPRVVFGATATRVDSAEAALAVAVPLLAGACEEEILPAAARAITGQGCTLLRGTGETAGFVVADGDANLEDATRALYGRILAMTRGLHLHRIWNYVPQINAVKQQLENYRHFCRGRSLAFEAHFGSHYQCQLPAASAVGVSAGPLAIAFLAGETVPRHFENPRQVPAFEYPADYGPRPPSFSRATLVTGTAGRKLFISGTAAIRGHATIGAGDLAAQLACTRDNLCLIAAAAGAGENFGAADGWQRMVKVYVRRAADLRAVRQDLERHLLLRGETATYLHADLCRSDLLVEVEAVLTQQA